MRISDWSSDVCSSDLTRPAESHEAEHGPEAIKLSPEQLRSAGIDFSVAGPAQIRETLSLYGAIVPNAERVRDIAARYPGVIRSVDRSIGDTVRQGQVLATVERSEEHTSELQSLMRLSYAVF